MTISRRTLLIALAIAVAAIAWWLWPGNSSRYVNLPPTATGEWVAFGDSLTEGFGASPGADYPAELSRRLGIPILNRGNSGETSADGLNRLPQVEELNPRVVLLCFGGNDALRGVPRDQMLSNLGALIDRLHARGSFVVLIGIRSASLMRDRNAGGFKQLAREKRVLLVPDLLEGVIGSPSLMSDYIHPNDAGYARVAERLERALRPVLRQLQT